MVKPKLALKALQVWPVYSIPSAVISFRFNSDVSFSFHLVLIEKLLDPNHEMVTPLIEQGHVLFAVPSLLCLCINSLLFAHKGYLFIKICICELFCHIIANVGVIFLIEVVRNAWGHSFHLLISFPVSSAGLCKCWVLPKFSQLSEAGGVGRWL